MSETKEWNTKQVRDFKQAFGTRNSRGYFSAEPPHVPDKAYLQAKDMLGKRSFDAILTFQAVKDAYRDIKNNSLIDALYNRIGQLQEDTNSSMKRDPTSLDKDNAKSYDLATQDLIDKTDAWTQFEARCIIANNDLKIGVDDAGVRQKLADRANALTGLLNELVEAAKLLSKKPDLSGVTKNVTDLTNEAGKDGKGIADTAKFGDDIETCKKLLRVQTKIIIDGSEKAKQAELYKSEIKQMYGIEVKPSDLLGFPYENFLDTLAMVPRDHAMNDAMTKVSGEYLGLKTGGDYTQSSGSIRINPIVSLNVFGAPYQDPETKSTVRVDNWKSTTLHEIGHAVDAAYGIMSGHGKDKGCGAWTQQDPLEYLTPQTQSFNDAMRKSGIKDKPFVDSIGGNVFDEALVAAATGNKTPEELRDPIQKFWEDKFDTEFPKSLDDRLNDCYLAASAVANGIIKDFPDVRKAGDYDQARKAFETSGDLGKQIAVITDEPALVTANAFWAKFRALVENPSNSSGDTANWLIDQVGVMDKQFKDLKLNGKKDTVARWTDATLKSLPKPNDLKAYLADASPWTKDLSEAKIGKLPASHQAYKGNTKWWRYDAGDRKSTYVSDYQWRAPGEWFAELYAITWIKQVEPPGGVAKIVRQYLYGGHISPSELA